MEHFLLHSYRMQYVLPPGSRKRWCKLKDVCRAFDTYPSTVYRWEQKGQIKVARTPSGQRLYDPEDILALLNGVSHPQKETQNIIYARVSSKHQQDDLERQVQHLRSEFPHHQLVTDVGSGINLQRRGLQTILELAHQKKLGQLVVSHRDRLCRFGFELVQWIVDKNGGKILVLDKKDTQSKSEELAEDLLSIITVFNARNNGRRPYGSHSDCSSREPIGNKELEPASVSKPNPKKIVIKMVRNRQVSS